MVGRPTLYRMYDANGRLLYVGATTNLASRLQVHARTQPWWDEIADIKLKRFETVEELKAAERLAIETEDCLHNVMHTQPFIDRKPRRIKGEGSLFRRADGTWIGRIELPPDAEGRRRSRTVSSKNREEARRKFVALKKAVELGTVQ